MVTLNATPKQFLAKILFGSGTHMTCWTHQFFYNRNIQNNGNVQQPDLIVSFFFFESIDTKIR